uniref:Lines homolog 1 n=1 Tax=Astyanax mexicanus TaxID=7994 RepID=W5L451_ASTMX
MDMDDPYSDLQAVFQIFQAGVIPGTSSEELAGRVFSALKRTLQPLSQSPLSAEGPDVDSACLCLTLIGKMIAGLSGNSLPQNARTFYRDVLKKVFTSADLMSELMSLYNCGDRLLSHLTAKCVSSFVIDDTCGDVDAVWTAACAETFGSSPPGCTLDTSLWSLTEVIKGILRGECANKPEILRKLLAGFEEVLTSLFFKMLLHDAFENSQVAENITDLDVTVSTFMDLLEALCAARPRYGVCSTVQRLMFLHSSVLLRLMDSCLGYFVKKRVLLLLKRTVVQRPGEDWALGDRHSALQEDEFLAGDMLVLADAVLQEVAAGWFRRVWVKPQPSFLGGNRQKFPEGEGKDVVMLRATSLILIKSLQIRTQHAGTEESERALHVQEYLLELLAFLQQRVAQFKGEPHSCSWILMVFAEQDDDMMEALKTLTSLYLFQRSTSSSGCDACSWGCNPHCHFILLLQSLCFDHTVLLDFLISTETCFLEYCVLYLKLLRDNWRDFSDSCCCIKNSGGILKTPHSVLFPDWWIMVARRSLRRKKGVRTLRDYLVEKLRKDSSDSLVSKVMSCLTELKTVLCRLHSRGLFPYNPTSLLKLIKAVEAKAAS